jgi:hypothetical protein
MTVTLLFTHSDTYYLISNSHSIITDNEKILSVIFLKKTHKSIQKLLSPLSLLLPFSKKKILQITALTS